MTLDYPFTLKKKKQSNSILSLASSKEQRKEIFLHNRCWKLKKGGDLRGHSIDSITSRRLLRAQALRSINTSRPGFFQLKWWVKLEIRNQIIEPNSMGFAELTKKQKRLVRMAELITLPYSNIPQPHDHAPVARNSMVSMHTIRVNL